MAIVIACVIIKKLNKDINRFDATLVPILCHSIITGLYYWIGYCSGYFLLNTTSIIALLRAAGLVICFALKDTLSNIAAGIMLLILRPFRVDDFIEVGTIVDSSINLQLRAWASSDDYWQLFWDLN